MMKSTITAALALVAVASTAPAKGFFVNAHAGVLGATSNMGSTLTVGNNHYNLKNGTYGANKTDKMKATYGLSAGYEETFCNSYFWGAALSVDLDSFRHAIDIKQNRSPVAGTAISASYSRDYNVSLLGRVGMNLGSVNPYFVAGVTHTKFDFEAKLKPAATREEKITNKKNRFGFSAGVGVRMPINKDVSANVQYLYTHYGKASSNFEKRIAGVDYKGKITTATGFHAVTVGFNFKF